MSMREPQIRILLAESENEYRKKIIRAIKAETKITVGDVAVNGYEAITKAIHTKPQIVLMNYQMETSMAGVFACKEMTAAVPEIMVILYGEAPSDEIVLKAFQMGAVNFLKGETPESELVSAVEDAYAGTPSIHHSTAGLIRREFKRFSNLQDNIVYILNVVIKLTPAEFNILKLLYGGIHQNEVTKILFIGTSTMKTHVSHILKKFNMENMNQVISSLKSTDLFSLIRTSPEYGRIE
jgi:DNA-binding NarL/FixJ family response regulator